MCVELNQSDILARHTRLTGLSGRASVSQSVSSSRMLPACPQLHRQSSSCSYSLGAAIGSMRLSLDKTPQLGTLTHGEGEECVCVCARSVRQDGVSLEKNKSRAETLESPKCWNGSQGHEGGQFHQGNGAPFILKHTKREKFHKNNDTSYLDSAFQKTQTLHRASK